MTGLRRWSFDFKRQLAAEVILEAPKMSHLAKELFDFRLKRASRSDELHPRRTAGWAFRQCLIPLIDKGAEGAVFRVGPDEQ